MLNSGYHESTANGLEGLGLEALEVGANTFAFFTRNPRGGKAKDIDEVDAQKLSKIMTENNFAPVVAHAPYTMNPCSADPGLREYAKQMMIDDFARLEYIPNSLYNFHPGSHTGQGSDVGIDLTSTMINEVFKTVKNTSTKLLIETMSGKGSEIGRTFEEVKQIIDLAEQKFGSSLKGRLGVCLDTCHIWDGGYDIVSNLDGVVENPVLAAIVSADIPISSRSVRIRCATSRIFCSVDVWLFCMVFLLSLLSGHNVCKIKKPAPKYQL